MRIVCSGGHLTPVYSFAEVAVQKGDQVHLIGSSGNDSVEATELKKLGVPYLNISVVKYARTRPFVSIIRFPLILISIIKSVFFLKKCKANVVVTFGSYNAVPVGIAALVLRIPLFIHEQTRTAGLANRIMAPFATSCAISYEETRKYFINKKTFLTGNPIRSVFWNPPDKSSLFIPTNKPILYITGGNQGSKKIVEIIFNIAPQLNQTYQLVIQYGKSKPTIKTTLKDYIVKDWFDADQVSYFMNHARIIISRGGANTISEIMVVGKPSIIIPLPNASADEQQKNASCIANQGAGIVIDQMKLSETSLLQAISDCENKYEQFSEQAIKLKSIQKINAAELLYELATKEK